MNEQQRVLVIKLGGSAGLDYAATCDDIAAQYHAGWRVILVHGGSERTNRLGDALGHPPRFLTSPSGHTSRYTDLRTRDIFVMATAALNADLVCALQARGLNALGLSGLGGRLLDGQRKDAIRAQDPETGRIRIVRDDFSGRITSVNVALLEMLLAAGMLPVVAPVAISQDNQPLNVDGDRAAAAVASSLGASQLVILSNVVGLMRAYPDVSTLVLQVTHNDLDDALSWAQGRMKRKVISAGEALRGGVSRVTLADGRLAHPVSLALAGEGTLFTRETKQV